MENIDLLNNDLQVSAPVQNYLSEMVRWGKFLSILGFIFCGFMAIAAFFLPAILMSIPPYNTMAGAFSSGMIVGMTVYFLLFAILFFFPALYLFQFSVKMKSSLTAASQENFENSLKNLKSLFKFYGIFLIVLLSIYALVFVLAMVGVAFKS